MSSVVEIIKMILKLCQIHEDGIIEHFILQRRRHSGRHRCPHRPLYDNDFKACWIERKSSRAIEAEPGNFEILTSNIKLNQLTNVISLDSAHLSKEEKVKLYMPYEELGHTKYIA